MTTLTGLNDAYLRNCDQTICASRRDRESLAALVRMVGANPECVEVGSWTGGSAIAMADAGARVWCVDTWRGSDGDMTERVVSELGHETIFNRFLENVGERLDNSIFPVVADSRDAALSLTGSFDLVFIDADHRYESVRDDIGRWWPKVKPGGILCGHDIQISFPGVIRAVVESGPYEVLPDAIWFRRKYQ